MCLNKKIVHIVLISIFLTTGCYKESDYYYSANDIFKKLSMEISADSILADGNSKITIRYKFPIESDTALTSLYLKTTNGTFFESGKAILKTNFSKLDSTKSFRCVEVNLISSTKASISIITTRLQNYERKDTVRFYIAYPNKISLLINPFYVKNDTISEVQITSSLSSDNGIASEGRTVILNYSPDIGIINLKNSYSNGSGKANFTYVFTETTYIGDIIFIAKTINDNGDTISISSKLKVIE